MPHRFSRLNRALSNYRRRKGNSPLSFMKTFPAYARYSGEIERKMKMRKLEPCPFCGNKNISFLEHEDDDGEMSYAAMCGSCLNQTAFMSKKAFVISAWNRRYEQDSKPSIEKA